MLLAAVSAFTLLRRDVSRQFGSMSFGSLPELSLKSTDGVELDQRLLKGRIWVIHAGSDPQMVTAMANELAAIQKRTASGKRYFSVLSMLESETFKIPSQGPFHYVVNTGLKERGFILTSFGPERDGLVLLVDQNGVIRGRYNIKDVDGLRSFQGDLLRIL